jgi:dethiobiotin synthetase
MPKIIVAGIGTDVGKTIVSAILTTLMDGDYWKPIQCGPLESSDTTVMKGLINTTRHRIHPPAYSFKEPRSPHHSKVMPDSIVPPQTDRPLIIEGVGGIFVPLTSHVVSFDLFKAWDSMWVVVSRHYLGSINHTLLTLHALKSHNISIAGLIFNGKPNHKNEAPILAISGLPLLGRLLPEKTINQQTIQKYVQKWKNIKTVSGILSRR